MAELTQHEGHVLALIWRWQPTTAYFVRRSLEKGLASSFSSSPGSVYPTIERLERRGLVSSVAAQDDGRKTEQVRCTETGEIALRSWVRTIHKSDLLPEDPWRTRMTFADVLTHSERIEWLRSLRTAAEDQLALIVEQSRTDNPPVVVLSFVNAIHSVRARLAWINHALADTAASD